MRETVELFLNQKQLGYFSFPLSARLLLVTDGTVTELLEALLKEPVTVGHKHQKKKVSENQLHRHITLKGEHSHSHWLYAESTIYINNMNGRALDLLEGNTPIGKILFQVYPDNHRNILDCGLTENTIAAKYLDIRTNYVFTYRRYDVMAGQTLLINIVEWFPIDKIERQMRGIV